MAFRKAHPASGRMSVEGHRGPIEKAENSISLYSRFNNKTKITLVHEKGVSSQCALNARSMCPFLINREYNGIYV